MCIKKGHTLKTFILALLTICIIITANISTAAATETSSYDIVFETSDDEQDLYEALREFMLRQIALDTNNLDIALEDG